jgi:hypothetical protein
VIQRVDGPLPPYAQAPNGSQTAAHPPLSPLAPTPPAGRTPPTVTDAMIEISRPPLATTTEFAPTTARPAVQEPTTSMAPVATAVVMPPPATELITCPECGTTAEVTLNRRDSVDFCRTCDYPLFWTPSKVIRDQGDTSDESLRRLPGQAGRATIASVPCPFCYEPNALSAQTCLRCGRPMHPVEEPPPPAPVFQAPPPPPAVVEQPSKVAWWVWALLALGAAALIVLVVLIATHRIG